MSRRPNINTDTGASHHGHIDPFSGASGDMLLGAALDAGANIDGVCSTLAALNIPGWSLNQERVLRAGLAGCRARVTAAEDAPRSWRDIRTLLEAAPLPEIVRTRSLATFARLADVEGRLHGVDRDDVQFHEVGSVDSIVDVVGVCAALQQLDCQRWTAGPVALGGGTMRAAHGELPIPSPATVELLHGVPVRFTGAQRELCTPTGAALLVEWVDGWESPPGLIIERTGYGAGQQDPPEQPNLVRIFIGSLKTTGSTVHETLVELHTLVDDLSPELIANAMEEWRQAGALDVWGVPANTKKGRSAMALTCLCRESDADRLEAYMFRATSTLGVRRSLVHRTSLPREERWVAVGPTQVRIKVAFLDGSIITASPEHEDCVAAARVLGLSVRAVHELAKSTFWSGRAPNAKDLQTAVHQVCQEASD